ncbi:MAG: hypothetical protein JST00_24620 [Deltaproteobacteria bacterium]|nr:hypothetical protein [Deltaproteobacteria bacterium]
MPRAPGHDPGHDTPPAGMSWADYVEHLVSTCGSLAAVAERIASMRGFDDDVGSIERALRRLRTRGQREGGTWGARALSVFGLPAAADARARWMGAYHSRFNDLPVPLCKDLVRLWDRPPVSEAPASRLWLALAHATCAARADRLDEARTHLERAHASIAAAPAEAIAERLLALAFLASRDAPGTTGDLLDEVERLLERPMPDHDRACLHARWIDQRAYEVNHGRGESGRPDPAAAEALYRQIPTSRAPAFALFRRANGLAYARWKQGAHEEAAGLAREAVRHAGDGGHLRARAMALKMLARVVGGEEGAAAEARALSIVMSLEDEALRLRFVQHA